MKHLRVYPGRWRSITIILKYKMSGQDSGTVSSIFEKGLNLYNELCTTTDPSNTKEYQAKVKTSILTLEDATRLVSALGMFSTNENIQEVATSDLKFFLLPVLLGDLNLKLNAEDRLSMLNIAEIYYKDFLKRCKEYSVGGVEIPDENEIKEVEAPPRRPGPMGFEEMAKQREEKIRKFRETKDMENKLIELKKAIDNPSHDEATVRDYYLLLLKKFILQTIEELKSISAEKPIVEHIAKMKSSNAEPTKNLPPSSNPLKPIIITRDAVQKAVYGLGYPSIPAMTVEELVDQRMKDGWYGKNAGTAQSRSLIDQAKNVEMAQLKDEEEEKEKEMKTENDDEEQLARARQFDDWKDDHRRGWGNRHNMG